MLPIILIISTFCMTGCTFEDTAAELSYRNLGIRQMEEGNYEAAIDSFTSALDQSYGHVRELEKDINMQIAECLYRNGQPDVALDRINALIDYDASYANAYFMRANLNLEKGLQKEALEDYEKAVKKSGGSYEMYIEIYDNLRRQGLTEEGVGYLNQALKLRGNSRRNHTYRGYIYYLMGDMEGAQSELESAVVIELGEGEDDKAELFLAEVYEKAGEDAKAEEFYRKYGASHGDDPIVLAELGGIAMKKGEYTQALEYYQKGLEVDNPVNLQELMRGEIAALEYTGDFAEAKRAIAQYVLDYPDDEQAQRESLFLKTR